MQERGYNTLYEGEQLKRIAFPMGGIGAGMICLDGNGSFSHISLRHRPRIHALLWDLTGIRYDAVNKVLYVQPRIDGDFRSFLSTAPGYGTVGVKDGQPFVEAKSGQIDIDRVEYKR